MRINSRKMLNDEKRFRGRGVILGRVVWGLGLFLGRIALA
jgi:hypothetical protein